MKTYKAGIIGATGYTGSELVRILHHHPDVSIEVITSESRAGEPFSAVHPFFAGTVDMTLKTAAQALEMPLDVVFLALPHGVSMRYARAFVEKNVPFIDLSGDFRLSGPDVYGQWYDREHTYPQGFDLAVYGMPELNRNRIPRARLVACPGCYPTGSILALAPLLKAGLLQPGSIIIDAKSGTTGAGVKPSPVTHFPGVNENFRAYGLKKHRHTVEIQEMLDAVAREEHGSRSQANARADAARPAPIHDHNRQAAGCGPVQFTPHLLPVDRGILSTIYALPNEAPAKSSTFRDALLHTLQQAYADEPFVHLAASPPSLKDVRGTNSARVYVDYDARTGRVLLVSVIDNLVKGSSGQAVQCMNLMLGLAETTALETIALNP